MRHIHKQFLFIILASIAIGLSGCSKNFLDVNQDPNRVTDSTVTPELLFAAGAEGTGALNVGARAWQAGAKTDMQWAQSWVGYMAANGDFARDPTETSYNIDFNFNDVMWQTRYGVLFDLHQAEVKGLARNNKAIAGASIILSVKGFQELVDMFGDIPYSQAFQVATITRPAYDKAQDIYNALFKRLDTAISYLSEPASSLFTKADIVNQGNTKKWIQFANTLKLRLLIRQSQISGFDPAPEISKIFPTSATSTILGAGESVSVNPGYVNDLKKQNPFFANYGYTSTGVLAVTSTNANDYIVNILSSSNDPRLERFFQPIASGAFVGDVYGDDAGNIPSGSNSSYFGPALIGDSSAGGVFTQGSQQAQWIMPSYESLFFYAEAAARGWIPGADAKAAYEAAVTESFVWTGVPNADSAAISYMAANAIANWANAPADVTGKAKFIVFQKYIANTCVDPLESYSDQRRLNFLPSGYISANPARVSNKLPNRLLYAQSEYTTNPENVQKEGNIDPFTSKIFWQP